MCAAAPWKEAANVYEYAHGTAVRLVHLCAGLKCVMHVQGLNQAQRLCALNREFLRVQSTGSFASYVAQQPGMSWCKSGSGIGLPSR